MDRKVPKLELVATDGLILLNCQPPPPPLNLPYLPVLCGNAESGCSSPLRHPLAFAGVRLSTRENVGSQFLSLRHLAYFRTPRQGSDREVRLIVPPVLEELCTAAPNQRSRSVSLGPRILRSSVPSPGDTERIVAQIEHPTSNCARSGECTKAIERKCHFDPLC